MGENDLCQRPSCRDQPIDARPAHSHCGREGVCHVAFIRGGSMRLLTLSAGLLLVGLCVPMRSAEIKEGPLAAGKNLPGTFHPYNVTAREKTAEELEEADKDAMEKGVGKDKEKYTEERYTSEGKFHCLV